VIEWDEYTGRLEASETVDLRPRVGGLIESAPFTDGALVHTGQTLFVIDPRPYKADYDKALADVDRAKAQAQQNSEELVRIENLRPTGAATEKELLDARYNKQAADAALASAKANARTAELNLEWTNVVAPINGRASRKLVTPGNLVNGGAGQATLLTTIVKFDPIYCYVDADEAAILKYQRLAREHTRVSARDTPIPAYVGLADEQGFPHLGLADFVDNRLTPGTGTLQARATIANPDARLTPGLFARVRVAGSGKYQAMLVVDHAVLSDQGRRYVLVVGANNIADIKPVEPGALFEGLRVVKGLKPDDWVVVNGYQFVRPGQPVAPTKAPMQLRHNLPEDQLDLTRQVPPTQPAATQPTTLPINLPTTPPAGPGTPPLVPPPATSPTTVPAAGGGGVAR
jgi:RND family efflux transporter MFP subunit